MYALGGLADLIWSPVMPASATEEPPAIAPVSMGLYDSDFAAFAKALGQSFQRYGFAILSDHDLPADLVEGAIGRTKAFFALPQAAKQAYRLEGGGGARGYTPFGIETAKGADHVDLKEFWHMGRDLPPGHPYGRYMPANVWPAEIDGFEDHVGGLYRALDALGGKILGAIAVHLDLDRAFFDDKVALGNSVLRLLHYPPVPPEATGVRAGAHEDINVITLLLGAEEAGLELLDRDGHWLALSPPPGAVVCNIGDMLQRLTNHALPSTTHRVVNPEPERRGAARYSTPFFLHFEPDFLIQTLPSCVSAENPDRYAPITAEDYLQERLREIKLA
jgi:isopenicillin N synthase-like dioxygenase